MVAMGGWGKGTYLADSWNRLDFFIVMSGALEYCLQVDNLNLTAIRTIRVLRPLRAINRIPSEYLDLTLMIVIVEGACVDLYFNLSTLVSYITELIFKFDLYAKGK